MEIPGGTETILVVEDEELMLELVKNVLESYGFKVIAARDGCEATSLYKLHQEEISLVLSDLGLPKLHGTDLARKLQEINPHVKIVVATGYLDPKFKRDLRRQGVREFIAKPYKPTEVITSIRRVLESSLVINQVPAQP